MHTVFNILLTTLLIIIGIYFIIQYKKVKRPHCSKDLLFQRLWLNHGFLTREYLIRASYKLPVLNESAERLLTNCNEIAAALGENYHRLKFLLRENVKIMAKVVDKPKNPELKDAWNTNARLIATEISKMNPNYDVDKLENYMLNHVNQRLEDIIAFKNNKIGSENSNYLLNLNEYIIYPAQYYNN